jgi:hypothetical protein
MALTDNDKKEVEKIFKKEIKDFMDSTNAHKVVIDMVKKEMGTRDINDKVVDLATKVVVELFKTLWQKKSFWESSLKNVS